MKIQHPHYERPAFGCGYIYVIGLENGVVKIGRTRTPRERISTHQWTLGKVSPIKSYWVSPAHGLWVSNEQVLRALLGGSEMAKFQVEDVMRVAKSLDFESPPPKVAGKSSPEETLKAIDQIFGRRFALPHESICQLFSAWESVSGISDWMSREIESDDLDGMRLCLIESFLELREAKLRLSSLFSMITGLNPENVDAIYLQLERERLHRGED